MASKGDEPQRLGDVGGDGPPINRLGGKSDDGGVARLGDAGGDGPPINRIGGKGGAGARSYAADDGEPAISRLAAPATVGTSGTGTARLGDAGGDGPPINPVPPRGYAFTKIKVRAVALVVIAAGLGLGLTGSMRGFLAVIGIGLALDVVDFILGLRLASANAVANAREKRVQR